MRILILCGVFLYAISANDLPYDYVDEPTQTNKMNRRIDKKIKILRKKQEDKKEDIGWIIGIGGNISLRFENTFTTKDGIYYLRTPNGVDFGVNLLGGYKWFFSQGFGMRLYTQYNPIFTKHPQTQQNLYDNHSILLNYDLLFNWVKTKPFKWGMILGTGMGADIINFNKQFSYAGFNSEVLFSATLNVGFRFVIFNNHAIETISHLKLAIGTEYNLSCYSGYFSDMQCYKTSTPSVHSSIIGTLRYVYTF